MHPLDELKDYVGFTDEDTRVLREVVTPVVQPEVLPIIDGFYEAILGNEGARAVLANEAQVERLKVTLQRWLRELLEGPHDHAYYKRRLAIGRRHVEVGLKHQYMHTAMSVVRRRMDALLLNALDDDVREPALDAVGRICEIELAVMTGTYMEERERRELHHLGDVIVSHLPLVAFLVDEDGIISAHTEPDKRLCASSDCTGISWRDALLPAFTEATRLDRHLRRAIEQRREIALPRVDVEIGGRFRAYRVTVVPLDHRVAAALIHIDDLTETIEVEARARQQEHLRHIGTMAASVAHEIRNPLAGMSSTIQVIVGTLDPEDRRREALEKVRGQVRRLNLHVTDLLTFARPVVAEQRELFLADFARQAASDAAASGHGDAEVVGDGRAVADPHLIGQVMLNLIQNAWQAGAEHVRVELNDGEVRIVDDGPGLSEEARARLWEPFFTTKTRGTGLGLPIAQKAVAAMDGEITVCDSPLGGTCFCITVPAAAGDDRHD